MTRRTVFKARQTTAQNEKTGISINCLSDNTGKLFDENTHEYLGPEWKEQLSISTWFWRLFTILIVLFVAAVATYCYQSPLPAIKIAWLVFVSTIGFSVICAILAGVIVLVVGRRSCPDHP